MKFYWSITFVFISFLGLIIIPHSALAQRDFYLKGKVFEQGSNELIPFATLRIKGTHLGTITEEDGSFSVKIPRNYRSDTLQFSCVGYNTKEIAIATLSTSEPNQVFLEFHVESLDDVVVSNGKELDAKKILRKAIRKIKSNYDKKTHTFDAYYRERLIENGATIKFADAALTFEQTGYRGKRFLQYGGSVIMGGGKGGNMGVISSLMIMNQDWGSRLHDHFGHRTDRNDKVKIHDARSSLNLTKESMEANIEAGPLGTLSKDVVRYLSYFMDKKNDEFYKYSAHENLNEDGTWDYVVTFEPTIPPFSLEKIQQYQEQGKRFSRTYILSGTIHIDQESFAIKRVSYHVDQKYRRHICNLGAQEIKHYGYAIDVSFKEGKDHWYLDKLSRIDEFIYKDTIQNQTTPYATIAEIFVTNPASETKSISQRESFSNYDSNFLYDYAIEYNPDFWKKYESENPVAKIDASIRKDMEEENTLEKQFSMKHMRDENLKPPVAPIDPDVLQIHDISMKDNYGWFINKNPKSDARIMDYLQAENKYLENYLIPLKKNIRNISASIWNASDQKEESVPVLNGDYWYWSLYEEGNSQKTLYRRRDRPEAKPQKVLDLNSIADSVEFFQFNQFSFSHNNQYLLLNMDTVGDGKTRASILNLSSGEVLKDSISNINNVIWSNDSQGFFYILKNQSGRRYAIYYHELGAEFVNDSSFMIEPDRSRQLSVVRSKNQDFIFIINQGLEEAKIYVARNEKPFRFKLIHESTTGAPYYRFNPVDDKMYVFTNHESPNGKLMVADTADFNLSKLELVAASTDQVILKGYEVFKDWLVLHKSEQMKEYIEVKNLNSGEVHRVKDLIGTLGVYELNGNYKFDSDTLVFSEASPHKSSRLKRYNMRTRDFKEDKSLTAGMILSQIFSRTKLVWATARDGAQIPVSIVYMGSPKMKSLEERPVLFQAYGAYGNGVQVKYDEAITPLINAGFIFAFVHTRGGNELGEDWSNQAKGLNKKTSIYDFEDAVGYFKEEKIGNPRKYFAKGEHAGSVLVADVINRKPDLFAGAFINAAIMDLPSLFLDALYPPSSSEHIEWGSVDKKKDFNSMMEYSPYQNIKAQNYPRMMFTAELSGKPYAYWDAAKMVAQLRATKTDDHVLLLNTSLSTTSPSGFEARMNAIQKLSIEYAVLSEWLQEVENEIEIGEKK